MIAKRTAMAAVTLAGALYALPAAAETPVERGAYLVTSIAACGNCHTPKGPNGEIAGMALAGGFVVEEPGLRAVSANITPDPETGIGDWTDAQIATAIREGKRPDGTTIGPPMPFALYRTISDSDVAAIVAYLRTVKPVKNAVARSEYAFPLPPAWGPPVGAVADVPRADEVAYGAYLAGPMGHCMECHTPFTATPGVRDFENRLGAGGQEFPGPWGVSVAPNITPAGAISEWTDEQVKTAITKGVRPDGSKMFPPMGYHYYDRMSEADLDAIVAYLRSLPPRT